MWFDFEINSNTTTLFETHRDGKWNFSRGNSILNLRKKHRKMLFKMWSLIYFIVSSISSSYSLSFSRSIACSLGLEMYSNTQTYKHLFVVHVFDDLFWFSCVINVVGSHILLYSTRWAREFLFFIFRTAKLRIYVCI